MPAKNLPQFPYGAVYFRWSNPPREDWERDYKTASEDGVNIFRHWFMWSTIEQAPRKFVWDAYDRQLDLAAKNGIKTICSEWCLAPPEWAYRRFAHARTESRDCERGYSEMSGSCATGGFHGLCLDSDPVGEQRVKVRLPEGKTARAARLLVRGGEVPMERAGAAVEVTVPGLLSHEVVAIDL